jgi:hypothetical protein
MVAEPILFSNQGDPMKYATAVLLITSIAALSGCSTMKVTSEQSDSFDFSQVETYEWVQAPAKILDEDDTYLNEDMHKALNNELSARGWKQVLVSDKADIQVIYYIKLKEHEEYTTPASSGEPRVTGGFTYNQDKGNWGYNDQAPDLNVYTVEVGTLSMLVYNVKTGERVWRGSLQTKLDRSKPIEKQQDMLRKVAQKITGRLP